MLPSCHIVTSVDFLKSREIKQEETQDSRRDDVSAGGAAVGGSLVHSAEASGINEAHSAPQAGAHSLLCEVPRVPGEGSSSALRGEMVLFCGILVQKPLMISLSTLGFADKKIVCGGWNSKANRSQCSSLEQGTPFFDTSEKGQIVHISCLSGHRVSVATIQLCLCS